MADISLIEDVCMDDCDEGVFEQGYCLNLGGSPPDVDDDVLPPLTRVQQYAQSRNVYDRQLVARIVQGLFQTAPADVLEEEIPSIMTIVRNLGETDEAMVRTDLLEQIPHMASQALKHSERVEALKNVIGEHLLPLVVRNLGASDSSVDKVARMTLIQLLEGGMITKQQAEIQVCPAVLALTTEEQSAEINTNAITLMSKMVPLLGRDVTERVFLGRYSQLCSSNMFYTRKVCVSCMGNFCTVVGKDQFEKILLPCYVTLSQDEIWGVRKSCAEVIMFISSVCSLEIRRTTLAPVFAQLLQDDCRWVQMAAFQTLGAFISTFADPPITSTAYNADGELVFVNKDGNEFLINSPSVPDARFKYLSLPLQQSGLNSNQAKPCSEVDWWDWVDDEESKTKAEAELFGELKGNNGAELDVQEEGIDLVTGTFGQTDEDIKEIVETVKNAVLSYRNVEQEHGAIGDNLNTSLSNSNVINVKNANCDITELDANFKTMSLDEALAASTNDCNQSKAEHVKNNQVISNSASVKEDDNLDLYNSYNYWYISPDLAVDLSILDETPGAARGNDAATLGVSPDGGSLLNHSSERTASYDVSGCADENDMEQDIVPQVLINHFVLMTDSSFSINIDTEMSYHCAYSLPAVALTLKDKNWPLLKHTIERLANDMQYKVRRTLASCLHELASILGEDIATEHLTPIFEGFIKDLDEVSIGILKHLAHFLRIIKPEKRVAYLPRLHEFLKLENEANWRFRHELAKQLLSILTLFKPVDCIIHIGVTAECMLQDVSAVRQVAISLMTELLRYLWMKPRRNNYSPYLVRLVEKFAHSKTWKQRQTFALLCYKLLSSKALPPELFATEVLPHLLDLSWDPVANVRLVVAKTVAQHIIRNEYFADPSNQHFDSLETVIQRLQADKDRDVRQYAQTSDKFDRPPTPIDDFDAD